MNTRPQSNQSEFKPRRGRLALKIFLGCILTALIAFIVTAVIRSDHLAVAAKMPSEISGRTVNARVIAYDQDIGGTPLGYTDFDQVKVDPSGVLRLDLPAMRDEIGDFSYIQLCIDGDLDTEIGDEFDGIESCDNNLDAEHRYEITGCTRFPVFDKSDGWLESLISDEDHEIYVSSFCNQVYAPGDISYDGSRVGLPETSDESETDLKYDNGILTVGDSNVRIDRQGGDTYVTSVVGDSDQTLTLDGDSLSLSGGGTIDLSKYLDNTDGLAGYECGDDQYLGWVGDSWQCVDLADINNETMTLVTVNGSQVSYTNEAGDIVLWDITDMETNSTLIDNGDQTFTYTDEDGATTIIDVAESETVTSISNLISGNQIAVYTNEDGVSVAINESITDLVDNNDGTFSYTNEDGITVTIDIAQLETTTDITGLKPTGESIAKYTNEDGVLYEIFESVTTITDNGNGTFSYKAEDGTVTTIDVSNLESLTSVTNLLTGNRIATYVDEAGNSTDINESITSISIDPQNQKVTYTNESGQDVVIDIADLETTTNLTNVLTNGQIIGRYTNEDGIAVELRETVTTLVDNGDGSFTYTSEDGTVSTFAETTTSLTQSGSTIIYTDEDGNQVVIDVKDLETITSLSFDPAAQTFTYTNEDGVDVVVDIQDLETTTTLALDPAAQTFTYTNEDGVDVVVDIQDYETLTSLSINPTAQTFTYVDEDGVSTAVDIKDLETTTTISATGSTITYTDEDGNDTDIDIKDLETLTSLAQNTDGTITYTDEDGVQTTVAAKSFVQGSSDVTVTGDGSAADPYVVSFTETHTTLTNVLTNGQLIGKYTNEDGVVVDIRESVTVLVNNNDGTYTYTSEDGTVATITDSLGQLNCSVDQIAVWNGSLWVCQDVGDVETTSTLVNTLTAGNLIGTYTDEDGAVTNVYETVTSVTENTNGTFSYTDEAGLTTTVDISNLETTTTISINPSAQEFTYTNEDGTQMTVDIADLETTTQVTNTLSGGHLIARYTNEDGVVVDVFETDTTLVDNNDGTFTYTSESGQQTQIDVSNLETLTTVTGVLTSGHKIGTYTNEDGVQVDLLETITSVTQNIADQTFTFTAEDGSTSIISIEDLETLTSITNVISGHRIATYTDEDGNTIDVNETITSLVNNGDGSLTFTNESGTQVTYSETLTTVINTITGNRIGTYTNEDGVDFDLSESITALVDNGDGTFTFTHEGGSQTTLDVADMETISNFSGLLASGHTIGTYVDEDGNQQQIKESVTTLVDNGDQTVTYTAEDGTTTTIDIASLETLTTLAGTLTSGNKIGTYTNEDGTAVDIRETITGIVDNGNGTFTYTPEDGNTITLDVKNLETTTTLVNNNDGTFTYTNEDGQTSTIDIKAEETTTTVAVGADGHSIDYTNEDGNTTNIDIKALETTTTLTIDTINQAFSYTNEDGTVTTVSIAALETTTTLAIDAVNQTFTYTNEDGTPVTVDIKALETTTTITPLVTGNDIASYTNEDGVTVTIAETITSIIDNNDGTFSYTDEDGAVTTIDVSNLETLSTLTNVLTSGHDIGTYTNEDGVTVDLKETITTIVDNNDGTFTFTAEDGTTSIIDVANLETLTTVTNIISGHRIATYTDENGNSFDIDETITSVTDNNDGTFSFSDETGTITIIDIAELETLTTMTNILTSGHLIGTYTDEDGNTFDIKETITSITQNNDGTFTYVDEDGISTIVDIRDLETLSTITGALTSGHSIGTYTDEDGNTVDIKETITDIVDNNDGTFTFTAEDGSTKTLDVSNLETTSTLVDNNDGSFTYTDEDGNITTFTETLTSITNTITGNTIATYTNEDGVAVDIDETITTVTVDASAQTISYLNEDGVTTTVNIKDLETTTSISIDASGQTFTYTDEDGIDTTVNIKDLETTTTISSSGSVITYTDEDGNDTDIDIKDLETLTSIVQNANGTLTYTDEDGNQTTVSAKSFVTGAGDITVTGDGSAGSPYQVSFTETITTVTNTLSGGKLIAKYTNEDGVVVDIKETITTLVDNGNGTYTYTSEDGTTTTISDTLGGLSCATNQIARWNGSSWVCDDDKDTTDLNISDGTNTENISAGDTIKFEAGSGLEVSVSSPDTVLYKLKACSTDQILKWIGSAWVCADDKDTETTTTLVDNNDGTYTYTSEDNTVTVITDTLGALTCNTDEVAVWGGSSWVCKSVEDLETLTSLAASGSVITYTDEDGNATNIDVKNLETTTNITNTITGHLIGKYTNEDGTVVDLRETITKMVVNNSAQTITYTSENGTVATADIKNLETTSTLVDNNDGTYTYTDEDGNTTVVTDTLSSLSCADDELVRFDSGSGSWKCEQSSLSRINCTAGEVIKWNGTDWACGSDDDTDTDTLAGLSCVNGQIAVWNGTGWACDNNIGVCEVYEFDIFGAGSSSDPFINLGETSSVSSAGVYYFDLDNDGTNDFSTFVDADGYVQVVRDFGNGVGALPTSTAQTDTARGTLTPAVLATLTDASEVRMMHDGGSLDATNNNAGLVNKIITNKPISFGSPDNAINDDWIGTDASLLTGDATAPSTFTNNLQSTVFHASGNANTTFFIPTSSAQRADFSAGDIPNADSLVVFVKAPSQPASTVTATIQPDGTYLGSDSNTYTAAQAKAQTNSNCASAGGGGSDTLAGLSCNTDQIAMYDGSAWVCAEDQDTLAGLNCVAGQFAMFDGSDWVCADTPNGDKFEVENSYIWAGDVTDPDIHLDNDTLDIVQTRADAGWAQTATNEIKFTGSPDHVEVDLMAVVNNTGNHWATPHIVVYRNGVEIAEGAARYMDNSTTYSGRMTTNVNFIDENPGTDPVYTFKTFEDDSRTMNDATIPNLSPTSLKAVVKEEVDASIEEYTKAFGKVAANGSAIRVNGATVSRTGTGEYTVTLDTPRPTADYSVNLSTVEPGSTRDSIDARVSSQTANSFTVQISEGDNGTTANVLVDRDWFFEVLDFN